MAGLSSNREIIILTAGGAGMFCGSCMQDNSLAWGLRELGEPVTLLPLYTPIRVDESDASESKVYFGGLNIYLNQKYSFWKHIPRVLTGWLDHPAVIQFATSFSVSNQAKQLGDLTLSMLSGVHGPHITQIKEIVNYLTNIHHPRAIIFSNVLISGIAPELRKIFKGHLSAIIQGDGLFLDQLPDKYRNKSIELIRENAKEFDCFYTHSQFYREYISKYLGIPLEKIRIIPLGIKSHHRAPRKREPQKGFVIGYFARMSKEKGFASLVEAFRIFHEKYPDSKLFAGGFMSDKKYFDEAVNRLGDAHHAFNYKGSPKNSEEKSDFYNSIDVLTVPVQFEEPKGIYALEAMSHGVPVVLPRKGGLTELIEKTSGGFSYNPDSTDQLIEHWEKLKEDHALYEKVSLQAVESIRRIHDIKFTAQKLIESLR